MDFLSWLYLVCNCPSLLVLCLITSPAIRKLLLASSAVALCKCRYVCASFCLLIKLFFSPVHIRSSFSWKKLLDNVYISPEVENPFKNILFNVLIARAEQMQWSHSGPMTLIIFFPLIYSVTRGIGLYFENFPLPDNTAHSTLMHDISFCTL